MLLPRPSLLLCLATVAVAVARAAPDGPTKNLSSPECQSILRSWLQSLRPAVDASRAVLTIDWTPLDAQLRARSCRYDQMWAELWRVRAGGQPAVDFGSADYFAQFERCNKLDPDLFVQHGVSHEHVFETDADANASTNFRHVVEEEYMVRLCPCGRRAPDSRVCECEYGNSHCSEVLELPVPGGGGGGGLPAVFDWCRGDADIGGGAPSADNNDNNNNNQLSFLSPVVNCDQATLSGTLASCTAVQDYDSVRLLLHKANDSVTECDWSRDHRSSALAQVIAGPLVRSNATHGDFSVSAGNLQPDSTYCLTLELVDHPYCQVSPLIGAVAGGGTGGRPPPVCSTHVLKPLKTSSSERCGGGVQAGQIDAGGMGTTAGLLAAALVALAALTALVAVFLVTVGVRRRRAAASAADAATTNLNGHANGAKLENGEARRPLIPPTAAPKPDLFLFYFPEEDTNFCDVNAKFRLWLGSLGFHVFDLADEAHLEDISVGQEDWLTRTVLGGDRGAGQQTLEGRPVRPDTKVILVTSAAARRVAAGGVIEEGKEDAEGRLLPPDAGDSLHPLRVYALNYLRSHYAGKYSNLLVVRHGEPRAGGSGDDALLEQLTPHRQLLQLPGQLDEVCRWLGADSSCPESAGGSIVKDQRQQSRLLELDYRQAADKCRAGAEAPAPLHAGPNDKSVVNA